MAIIQDEPAASACIAALRTETDIAISAGTVAEALIVAERRQCGAEMTRLIDEFGFIIVPVTLAAAQRVASAYGRWGKGIHPAGLNFGDCFAYELAQSRHCPLLFVGTDFARTDIEAAIPA